MSCVAEDLKSGRQQDVEDAVRALGSYEGDAEEMAEALYHLIWSTPVFKRQVALIDLIVAHVGRPLHAALLGLVLRRFDKIKSDRHDKFFYFFERSLWLLRFEEILALQSSPLLEHACRCIVRARPGDWDDRVFLAFLATCPPWLCEVFGGLRIPEETVRPFLLGELRPANRQAMYGLFSK